MRLIFAAFYTQGVIPRGPLGLLMREIINTTYHVTTRDSFSVCRNTRLSRNPFTSTTTVTRKSDVTNYNRCIPDNE